LGRSSLRGGTRGEGENKRRHEKKKKATTQKKGNGYHKKKKAGDHPGPKGGQKKAGRRKDIIRSTWNRRGRARVFQRD